MAHLGDGTRLHINSQGLGEVALDATDGIQGVDELVTGANQALVDTLAIGDEVEQSLCTFEIKRQTLNLSLFALGTTPHIVIGDTCACHDVHHADGLVGTASDTAVDDKIG